MRVDVLVMGAGPAGCAAAIRAARGGLKVALVERTVFPRDLPGEALHPEAESIFRTLGVAKRIAAAGFLRSPGWILHSKGRQVVLFASRGRLHFGYLAWRAELDALLLDHARTMGVKVLQPARVTAVALKERCAQTDHGEIRFRHLVDATGANSWLRRELKLTVQRLSPPLIARYGYVFGGRAKGVMPEFHEHACGWTWMARVRSDCHQFVRLTLQESAVLPALPPPYDAISRPRGADVTWRFVPECAGAGYFLCGDAAAVLDPAASSGVGRALASGRKAGELIVQISQGGLSPGEAADRYRRWSFRQFAGQARRISSRYAGLKNPPAWLGTLKRDFLALEESVKSLSSCNPGH
jgi:flavin-dependent dehydrogenase